MQSHIITDNIRRFAIEQERLRSFNLTAHIAPRTHDDGDPHMVDHDHYEQAYARRCAGGRS